MKVLWTTGRSNQSILKEISLEYSLEGFMLKLNFQYFGPLKQRADSMEKILMLGKIEGRRREWQRMRWLSSTTDSVDVNLSEFWDIDIDIIGYAKAFDCVVHNKLWKILKEMGIPDHLPCPLRNLYAGQEATVRTGHGTTDWFQIGKEVRPGCILSPCLFNFYAEYVMRNAGLEEA